jgi:hypothetical protein
LKEKISILLLVLTATSPLLAVSPCQVDCLLTNAVPAAAAVHGGQHSGMHAHANHAQPLRGAKVSTSSCGSHAVVAVQAQAYLLAGPEKSGQAMQVAPEPAGASLASTPCTDALPIVESSSAFPSGAISLRI